MDHRMTQKEIDEALVLAMEADKREIERLRADLSASQAREKVRVEALRVIAARPSHEPNRSNWEAIVWESIEFAEEALALPADDTALREMLVQAQEEMRERCAVACNQNLRSEDSSDTTCADGNFNIGVEECIDSIRALEVKP